MESIPHPAIEPLTALKLPRISTLNSASSNVASPTWIPTSASIIITSSPVPSVILLLGAFITKFVADNCVADNVKQPIVTDSAFITPEFVTLNG